MISTETIIESWGGLGVTDGRGGTWMIGDGGGGC